MKKLVSLLAVLFLLNPIYSQTMKNQDQAGDVLILLAHPNFKESKANKALTESVKDIKNVKIVDLYESPLSVDFYKPLMTEAKVIVFQFPFYWASAPSQLKKWTDEIFGAFAQTEIVKNKPLLVVTTTGSEYEAYRAGGRNQFTMDELLRPYQLQANHSGMVWQTPFVVYGTGLPTAAKSIEEGAKSYRKLIENYLK